LPQFQYERSVWVVLSNDAALSFDTDCFHHEKMYDQLFERVRNFLPLLTSIFSSSKKQLITQDNLHTLQAFLVSDSR
jgi:hypothetical protein